MKKCCNWKILLLIFLILWGIFTTHSSFSEDNYADILGNIFPEADSFSSKIEQPLHYEAFKINSETNKKNLVGIIFLTTDLAPEVNGYSGQIKMMVGIDLTGVIKKILIISHSETTSYTGQINSFLKQFEGKGIKDSLELGKDIDAITRATITSSAITLAIQKSLKIINSNFLKLENGTNSLQKKNLPLEQIFIPFALFLTAIIGIFLKNSIIRWCALIGGLIYFGIVKNTMFSVLQIINICLSKIPSFEQSPLFYALIFLSVLTSLILGLVYCGSLCPFASVQETLFNIFNKKPSGKITSSRKIDRASKYIKYYLLIILIAAGIYFKNSDAVNVEPYVTLFTQKGSVIAWIFLTFCMIIASFNFRFWCKYFCPAGAILRLFAKFSLFKIRKKNNCVKCGVCETICPTQAITRNSQEEIKIDHSECILCGKCIKKCSSSSLKYGIKKNE